MTEISIHTYVYIIKLSVFNQFLNFTCSVLNITKYIRLLQSYIVHSPSIYYGCLNKCLMKNLSASVCPSYFNDFYVVPSKICSLLPAMKELHV